MVRYGSDVCLDANKSPSSLGVRHGRIQTSCLMNALADVAYLNLLATRDRDKIAFSVLATSLEATSLDYVAYSRFDGCCLEIEK